MYLERSLRQKGQHKQFGSVMREYFDLNHAVPEEDLQKPESDVFYLPVHVVYKSSSTTTKVRAVFDASAKSASDTSLNDHLSVGPTVHSPLIDVLLRFRFKITITTDVSKMYRAIELVESDRDLYRFIWRPSPSCTLKDYRMTRVTFGVSASSFVANMCVRQNAINLAHEFPLAAKAVEQSFYIDDGLTGADDLETAIKLQEELQGLFSRGGFLLHKWNSSDPAVLQHISPELQDRQEAHLISDTKESTQTLGIEWKTSTDQFHLAISSHVGRATFYPPDNRDVGNSMLTDDQFGLLMDRLSEKLAPMLKSTAISPGRVLEEPTEGGRCNECRHMMEKGDNHTCTIATPF